MRRRLLRLRFGLALVLAFGVSFLAATASADVSFPLTVRTDGEPSIGLRLVAAEAPTFQTNVGDTLVPLYEQPPYAPPGSTDGVGLLLGGALDFAMTSYPVGPNSQAVPIDPYLPSQVNDWLVGKDAIVPIVNQSTLGGIVGNLSEQNLAYIYDCTVTNWQQINSSYPNAAIAPLRVIDDNGGHVNFLNLIGRGLNPVSEGLCYSQFTGGMGAPPLMDDMDVQNAVGSTPYSIGYVSMPYAYSSTTSPVAVNGVSANGSTVSNGSYPLVQTLHFLTIQWLGNGRLDEYSRTIDFVNFTVSSVGQGFVASAGFVPLVAPENIPDWDPTVQGKADVNSTVDVGQHWQQSAPGHPHWIREDTARLSIVDINSIIVVGGHWQATWSNWTQ